MRIPCVLSFAFVVGACSGSSPDASSGTALGGAGQELTASCEGAVQCRAGTTETSASLRRDATGSGCIVQGTTLLPGGSVEGDADGAWTSDAASVRVCHGPSCFTCERPDAPPPDASAGKSRVKDRSCHGVVACPSSPPCASVLGCYLHSHYHYDGMGNVSYVDYSCDGSATPCSEMTTADACQSQGCRWE